MSKKWLKHTMRKKQQGRQSNSLSPITDAKPLREHSTKTESDGAL